MKLILTSSLKVKTKSFIKNSPAKNLMKLSIKFLKKLYKGLLALLFNIYSVLLRPQLGYACKFDPTCSCYSKQAFKTHTAPKALMLTTFRILRCHPFGAGGYDPVPKGREIING